MELGKSLLRRFRSLSAHTSEIDEQEQIRLVESPDLDPKMNSYPPLDDVSQSPRIQIDRPVINQMVLYPKYDPHGGFLRGDEQGVIDGCFNCMRSCKLRPLKWLLSLVPILDWLPKYEWKKDLSFDLVAGFTIAVMHIPQGMAYALLGNLPPIVGIYMAFFPVILYSILGTSRQVSMGTFAVICLMSGKVAVDRLVYEIQLNSNGTAVLPLDFDAFLQDETTRERIIEIATAISLAVGLWQILMGILQLGSLSLLLSTELVSGFTTGAAVHVFTSQMKNLLGIPIPRRSGIFKIILTYVDIGSNVSQTNLTALILSLITIAILVIYNEGLKPYVSKKIPFPLPIELLTIIVGTLVSFYWNFEKTYNISIVSTIPTGLPNPKLAPMDVFTGVLLDGLIISIVAYAISISMCKIFATKHNYPVDPNQELLAEGASNVVGSFFSCAPIAASLSRSVIQDAVGGKTQLASLFSCGILIFVLLWLGPFFETLPNCILSGIIVVALKGMFLQFADLPNAWTVSKMSACVWVITFLSTVILDIEYGLGVGILLSILTLLWSSTHGHFTVLGPYSNFELYADINTSQQAKEIPGVKIIKYTGSLNFVNTENYVKRIERILRSDDESINAGNLYKNEMLISSISDEKPMHERRGNSKSRNLPGSTVGIPESIDWIILDFSSLSSVDAGALRIILGLYNRFLKEDIQILFAGSPSPVLHVMNVSSFLKDIGIVNFFPSVHDAVIYVSNLTEGHHARQENCHPDMNLSID